MSPSEKLQIRIELGRCVSKASELMDRFRSIGVVIPGAVLDDLIEEPSRIMTKVYSFNDQLLQRLEDYRE